LVEWCRAFCCKLPREVAPFHAKRRRLAGL
jgi:hypothetical protein